MSEYEDQLFSNEKFQDLFKKHELYKKALMLSIFIFQLDTLVICPGITMALVMESRTVFFSFVILWLLSAGGIYVFDKLDVLTQQELIELENFLRENGIVHAPSSAAAE